MFECNHHQEFREIKEKLDLLLNVGKLIVANEVKLMATIDQVLADVTAESTQIDGISTLIAGLEQQVADALSGATLPPAVQAKVDAVFAQAETNKGKLATALATGAPATPAPATPAAPAGQ